MSLKYITLHLTYYYKGSFNPILRIEQISHANRSDTYNIVSDFGEVIAECYDWGEIQKTIEDLLSDKYAD